MRLSMYGIRYELELQGKLLCEVITLESLVQDNQFIEALIPNRIQFCTRFHALNYQWETWEYQHGALPKEFVTIMLYTLHSDPNTTFDMFIRALLSLKSTKNKVKSWLERWTVEKTQSTAVTPTTPKGFNC